MALSNAANVRLMAKIDTLIATRGSTAVFTTEASYTYDEEVGEGTETPGDPITCKVTPPMPYTEQFKDNTTLVEGDVYIYASANSFDDPPFVGQAVALGTDQFLIVKVESIGRSDEILIYRLWLRR